MAGRVVLPVLVAERHGDAQDEAGQRVHHVAHLHVAQRGLGNVAEHDAVQRPAHPAFAHEPPERRVLLLHGGDAAQTCEDERQDDGEVFRPPEPIVSGDVDDP